MFISQNKKTNVYPWKPHFSLYKVWSSKVYYYMDFSTADFQDRHFGNHLRLWYTPYINTPSKLHLSSSHKLRRLIFLFYVKETFQMLQQIFLKKKKTYKKNNNIISSSNRYKVKSGQSQPNMLCSVFQYGNKADQNKNGFLKFYNT